MRRVSRTRSARVRRVVGVPVALVLLAGCASWPGAGGSEAGAGSRALERLTALAERGPEPRQGLMDLAPPDPALAPLGPDETEANAGLAEVMRSWPAHVEAHATDSTDPGATGEGASSQDEALRLYAQARQFDAAGEHSRAISLLEKAAEKSPGVPEIWRALGDARRGAGFEATSGAAYLKAADLGLGEPQGLAFAGLHALKRDEPERAAGLFIRGLRAETPHTDPFVANVSAAHLGEVLLDLGRVRAGCEALRAGLDLPAAARTPTDMGDEASAIYRRRGELLVRLGDGWCRLGEFGDAVEAYRDATETPTGDTPTVRARLVYALRRAGRPAAAGLMLIDDLRSGTMFDAEALAALSDIAGRLSPRTLLADAIAGIDDGGSATRRANLLLARAAASDAGHARRLLEQALLDPEGSSTSAARRRLLKARLGMELPTRRVRLAERLVRGNPALAAATASALYDTDAQPGTLRGWLVSETRDPAARDALLGETALLIGDKAFTRSMLDESAGENTGGDDPATLARRAALAAACGRWGDADRAIGRLEAAPADVGRAHDDALIRAYQAEQRFDTALPVARRLADRDDATTDDLLRLSALSHLLGDDDAAGAALDTAMTIDDADERVYRALVAFSGPNGPRPDADRTAEIGRRLRENLPSGRLLRQLVAGELLRRGLLDEAGDRLEGLFREDPTDGSTIEAMSSWWRLLVQADRGDEIPLENVRAAIESHPSSAGLVRLLADGLVSLDRADEALDEIGRYASRTGSPALSPLAEQITHRALNDPAAAAAAAEARIGPPPHAITESIELASVRAGLLDGSAATDTGLPGVLDALREIPGRSMLNDSQNLKVAEAVGNVASHMDRRESGGDQPAGSTPVVDAVLGCFAWAAERGVPLAPATHAQRLELMVAARAGLDPLTHAAAQAIEEYPDSARVFARRLVDVLRGASRTDDAQAWIASASFDDAGDLRPGVVTEWLRLVVQEGSPEYGAAFIDTMTARRRAGEAFDLLRPRGGIWDSLDGTSPAVLAYMLAQYAVGSGETGTHEAFLRLALKYDPRQPWACNDLGYTLLESGGPLEEAERLVEIAYEALSDRPNVVDSLGWVRYHRGRLLDEPDGSGGVVEGAITLLTRAAEMLGDQDDGTVYDHLGDALYAAGRNDDAAEAWHRAAMRANNAASRLRAAGQAGGVRFREMQELATSAAMKRNALKIGAAPGVTPQRGVPSAGGDAGESPGG